jgi:hypothetical protein
MCCLDDIIPLLLFLLKFLVQYQNMYYALCSSSWLTASMMMMFELVRAMVVLWILLCSFIAP